MIHRYAFHQLREALKSPGPAVLTLHGPPRCGKSFALRQVCGELASDRPLLWFNARDVPAPVLAREWAASLRRQMPRSSRTGPEKEGDGASSPSGGSTRDLPADAPWSAFLLGLHGLIGEPRSPMVVLDDAHAVLQDRRLVEGLQDWWAAVRARGWQVHLVLSVSDPGGLPLPGGEGSGDGSGGTRKVALEDLTLREVAPLVPGWPAVELVETFALVGGLPSFWSRVDGRLRPITNLARIVLSTDAPLRGLPDRLLPGLEGDRSLAILHALARGAETWGEIRREAGIFRTSSELGPYMKGLEEAGLIDVRRSLDASPRSRSRRYRIRRPLLDFWFGPGLASGHQVAAGHNPSDVWTGMAEEDLRLRLPRRLPALVHAYLRRHGDERLPGVAREAGGLWGGGYDLPASGTLTSGAVVYGRIAWREPVPEDVDRVVAAMRETRYGFGREARIPLLVVAGPVTHDLSRRAAQVSGTVVITAEDLVAPRS